MTDEQQQAIDQQIEHERTARLKAADAIGETFAWAFAAARAFPENIGVRAWQPGATLILRYDEHEGVLI